MHQHLTQHQPSAVAIIDPLILRRAGMAEFLRGWSKMHGLSVEGFSPEIFSKLPGSEPGFAMGVLVVGAASICDPQGFARLHALIRRLPEAPAAVISDLSDVGEVVAALRAGARGFLPTSTDPDIALKALSFILKGGSYFPPAALLSEARIDVFRSARMLPDRLSRGPHMRSLRFSPRQQAVLASLNSGLSNKEIGDLLGMRETAVKDQVRGILKKLGVSNRTEAALCAISGHPGHDLAASECDPANHATHGLTVGIRLRAALRAPAGSSQ